MKTRWLTAPPHNEKGKCRWCLKPVPKGRRSWCSQKCVDEYLIRSSSKHVRQLVKKRDKGICAECGRDCLELEQRFTLIKNKRRMVRDWWSFHLNLGRRKEIPPALLDKDYVQALQHRYERFLEYHFVKMKLELREMGFDPGHRRAFWDADHIQEVVEGGGLCGLENFQTLCQPCHKQKSRKSATKRAKRARVERTGQAELDL